MARLFITYKHEDQNYAFAIRQWLMDVQGWADDDIFIDRTSLTAGEVWSKRLFAEAEAAEVMLFIASETALDPDSFCYRELRHARGVTLAVAIKGLDPGDKDLRRALRHDGPARQIVAIDQKPAQLFPFISPIDNTHGGVELNRRHVEGLGETFRELGIAPDSFKWTKNDEGPYPGLAAFQEGDEAIFFGRDLEIRDGLREIKEMKDSVTERALIIQAPSGAGKSSFVRAGLWGRLRRSADFTPLGIIRTARGALFNEKWGLVAELHRHEKTGLNLDYEKLAARVRADLPKVLCDIADGDARDSDRRTLLLAIDQAEEITTLSRSDEEELDQLFSDINKAIIVGVKQAEEAEQQALGQGMSSEDAAAAARAKRIDIRFILTARDDSIDATIARLAAAGISQEAVRTFRLHRMPRARFKEIITGPAKAAEQAGFPLKIDDRLADALSEAAFENPGEVGDALPILALSLQRMVKKRRTPNGNITLKPKEAHEFLADSVTTAANDAINNANAKFADLRPLFIPQLAIWDPKIGEGGAAKRQVAKESALFDGERTHLRRLADALVEQHLLTRTKADGASEAVYEVAHEALLHVEPLKSLFADLKAKFNRADSVIAEAREWNEDDRQDDGLGREGRRLKNAQALLTDPDLGPRLKRSDAPVEAYLNACEQKEKRKQQEAEKIQQDKIAAETARAEAAKKTAIVETARAEVARRAAIYIQRGLGVALVLLIIAVSFALFASNQRSTAITEGTRALVLQSRFLASLSHQKISDGHSDAGTAIAQALEGLPDETTGLDNIKLSHRPYLFGQVVRLDQALRAQTEEFVLTGHADAVQGAAFHFRGARFVTASDDGTARIWEMESRRELKKLQGHRDLIKSGAFSPSGAWIVTASADKTARLWHAANGLQLKVLRGHSETVNSAAFNPNGTWIVTASNDGTARIWDVVTGREVKSLKDHSGAVTSAAFSPNGAQVLTTSADVTARIWDLATGQVKILTGHTKSLVGGAFSPDGAFVVTASSDKTARVWNVATGKEVLKLEGHLSDLNSAVFSPDGTRILTSSYDNTARIWDAETGRELKRLEGHVSTVQSAVFSPDGKRILTASADRTVRIWDAEKGPEAKAPGGHAARITSVAFSRDGRRIVTASYDGTARIWDAVTRQELKKLSHDDWVFHAAFSPDGKRVVTTCYDGKARIWDVETGEVTYELTHELNDRKVPVYSAAFSTDGTRVVTGSWDDKARIWDAHSGREIDILTGHSGPIYSVVISPSGKRILTASADGTARIWNMANGEEIRKLQAHSKTVTSAAFSRDGNHVVTASSDNTVRVWDVATGGDIVKLRLRDHTDWVTSVAFDPDDIRIVTASYDGTARIWDVETGQEIQRLDSRTGWVYGVSFAPDGKRIATVSDDTAPSFWEAATGPQLIVRAKRAAPRCLTQPQRKDAFLPPEPPRWCITGPGLEKEMDHEKWKPLWPYSFVAWRNWLLSKDLGKNPPLPEE